MRFFVKDITDAGISRQEDIAAEKWDLDSRYLKFTGNIHLDCLARKFGNSFVVEVSVFASQRLICSRCLTEIKRNKEYKFEIFYRIKDIKGNFLEVDNAIRERILLEYPMKILCRQDCKGLCPGCGVNLNEEQCRCSIKKGA